MAAPPSRDRPLVRCYEASWARQAVRGENNEEVKEKQLGRLGIRPEEVLKF
jgi:hypothetical protein